MNNDVELIPVKGVLPSVQVQSDNVIYVPQAHKNKAGIVKEGDGVLIENGVVSLNKQTVEDMIDANKWVSYGFKQNLTEDEKGMARHNIGAGDNYFTGSYYDLTQKPHLNTNNTTGLDYGDEELNNTINLHKISKTGSFNDLKHVPQETLAFAESERQKSKNLFDIDTMVKYNSGAGINKTAGGTITFYNSSYTALIKIPVKPNTQYYLSSVNTIDFYLGETQNDGVTETGNPVNTTDWNQSSLITTANDTYYLIGVIRFVTDPNVVITKNILENANIQLEEGSVATNYQPYNGAIVHENNSALVFAESERQKSKTDGAIVHNNELLNKVYPIGSIYLSVNDTSPASIFGGTWEKIQDKFLIGSGSYSLGSEGGSTSHNHSLNNGFAKIGYTWASGVENSLYLKYKPVNFVSNLHTTNDIGYQQTEMQLGGGTELGGTTDNTETLPPYLVVNIWKRVG